MKNSYETHGDVTTIFLKRKDGTIIETIIDTGDLPKVQEFPNSWCASWSTCTKSFYVYGSMPKENGKQSTLLLHRWLMNAPKGLQVDHINHDTLDNRRSNLRIVTHAQNRQNLKGAQRDNKSSGIRGVSWHKRNKKWQAKIKLKGKQQHLGYFDDVYEASLVAAEARARMMPYSQEARHEWMRNISPAIERG